MNNNINNITTIKISSKTKSILNELRIYRRETYDDIMNRLLNYYDEEIISLNKEEIK